jgi:hypothetical protein
MARVSVTSQELALAGLAPALTGPTVDGDIVEVGKNFLMVTNGSGSPINVTIQVTEKVYDLDVADRVVAVAAGATKFIPLTLVVYKQPAGDVNAGKALVDYSAVASVTRAVVSFV